MNASSKEELIDKILRYPAAEVSKLAYYPSGSDFKKYLKDEQHDLTHPLDMQKLQNASMEDLHNMVNEMEEYLRISHTQQDAPPGQASGQA